MPSQNVPISSIQFVFSPIPVPRTSTSETAVASTIFASRCNQYTALCSPDLRRQCCQSQYDIIGIHAYEKQGPSYYCTVSWPRLTLASALQKWIRKRPCKLKVSERLQRIVSHPHVYAAAAWSINDETNEIRTGHFDNDMLENATLCCRQLGKNDRTIAFGPPRRQPIQLGPARRIMVCRRQN